MTALEDKIRGNWKELKGKIKQKYGQLTDDDLAYTKGAEDQLIGKLQTKLGKTKQEVKEFIDEL